MGCGTGGKLSQSDGVALKRARFERFWFSQRAGFGPFQFEALSSKRLLELGQGLFVGSDRARCLLLSQAMTGECAGGFADVPFDGVEPQGAVSDVGAADVFARGEEVVHATWNESSQRNLEGQ